jgi:hypothetical protein
MRRWKVERKLTLSRFIKAIVDSPHVFGDPEVVKAQTFLILQLVSTVMSTGLRGNLEDAAETD